MHKINRFGSYILLLLAVVLESTIFYRVKLLGAQPDILLISVLFLGLYSEHRYAVEMGMTAGLLRDIVSTGPFGANLVLFGITGYLASAHSNKIYKEYPLSQIILTMSAAAFLYFGFLNLKILSAGKSLSDFYEGLKNIVIPAVFYTSLVSPPVFFVLRHLFKPMTRNL